MFKPKDTEVKKEKLARMSFISDKGGITFDKCPCRYISFRLLRYF